jgi:hypothetical protein
MLKNFIPTWYELRESFKRGDGKYRFYSIDSIHGQIYQAGYKAGFGDGEAHMKEEALKILRRPQ